MNDNSPHTTILTRHPFRNPTRSSSQFKLISPAKELTVVFADLPTVTRLELSFSSAVYSCILFSPAAPQLRPAKSDVIFPALV